MAVVGSVINKKNDEKAQKQKKKAVVYEPLDGGYGWFIVFAYIIAGMTSIPIIQNFGLVYRDKLADLGLTSTDITTIVSLNSSFGQIMGVFQGPLLKKFGFRKMGFFGVAVFCVGTFLTGWANSFWHFILTYGLISSVGFTYTLSSFSYALSTYFKKNRSRASGWVMGFTGIGPVVMPLFVDYTLSIYGVFYTSLYLAALNAHGFIGASLLQPLSRFKKRKSEEVENGKEKAQYGSSALDVVPNDCNGVCKNVEDDQVDDDYGSSIGLNHAESLMGLGPDTYSIGKRTPAFQRKKVSRTKSGTEYYEYIEEQPDDEISMHASELFETPAGSLGYGVESAGNPPKVIFRSVSGTEYTVETRADDDRSFISEGNLSRLKISECEAKSVDDIFEEEKPVLRRQLALENIDSLSTPNNSTSYLSTKNNRTSYLSTDDMLGAMKSTIDLVENSSRPRTYLASAEDFGVLETLLEKDEKVENSLSSFDGKSDLPSAEDFGVLETLLEKDKKIENGSSSFDGKFDLPSAEDFGVLETLLEQNEKIENGSSSFDGKSDEPSAEESNLATGCCCCSTTLGEFLIEQFDLGLLTNWIYVSITLGLSIAVIGELIFSLLTPFILAEIGFDREKASHFMSTVAVSDIVARFASPYIGESIEKVLNLMKGENKGVVKVNSRVMYLFALFCLLLSRASLLSIRDEMGLVAVAIAVGFAKGVRTVFWGQILPDYVEHSRLASAMSIQNLMNGLLILLAGPLAGAIVEIDNSYLNIIYVSNAMTALTILLWAGEVVVLWIKPDWKPMSND